MIENKRRILVLLAHPVFEKSIVQKRLYQELQSIEGVTFQDLYEKYPDFDIDIDFEKNLLAAHDVIIFQHPFYWYSCPPMMKQWIDLVLEHGWAYGKGSVVLKGKFWLHAISTGGPEAAYKAGGNNRFTMRQLLAPFDQTAYLCGMQFLAPFVVHGSLIYNEDSNLHELALRYRKVLEALRDENLDFEVLKTADYITDVLSGTSGKNPSNTEGLKS